MATDNLKMNSKKLPVGSNRLGSIKQLEDEDSLPAIVTLGFSEELSREGRYTIVSSAMVQSIPGGKKTFQRLRLARPSGS